MTPKEIAERAAQLISGDRNRSHGNARDNFENIAAFWNVYLQKKSGGRHLTARDVGIMMALLKVARTLTGTHNVDDYLDGVGYLALAGGMAEEDVVAKEPVNASQANPPLQANDMAYYPHDITPVMTDGRVGKWDVA